MYRGYYPHEILKNFLHNHLLEVKIHYPVPIYLQPALQYLMYKKGDFPVTDIHTKKIILPIYCAHLYWLLYYSMAHT